MIINFKKYYKKIPRKERREDNALYKDEIIQEMRLWERDKFFIAARDFLEWDWNETILGSYKGAGHAGAYRYWLFARKNISLIPEKEKKRFEELPEYCRKNLLTEEESADIENFTKRYMIICNKENARESACRVALFEKNKYRKLKKNLLFYLSLLNLILHLLWFTLLLI